MAHNHKPFITLKQKKIEAKFVRVYFLSIGVLLDVVIISSQDFYSYTFNYINIKSLLCVRNDIMGKHGNKDI